MRWTVREGRADDDADLASIAAVVNEVMPEDPTSVEELRWQDANFPGTRFVALVLVIEAAGDRMVRVVNLVNKIGDRQLQLVGP